MTDLLKKYLDHFGAEQEPMAASVQSLQFAGEFITSHCCKSILDAGSGFSTLFFNTNFNHVMSVDDSDYWAEKTELFINEQLNFKINVLKIDNVNAKFDFVFYDYGSIEARIFHFKHAMSLGRYMLIDDMHVTYYREYVEEICKGKELRFLPETLDKYGRYSALLVL